MTIEAIVEGVLVTQTASVSYEGVAARLVVAAPAQATAGAGVSPSSPVVPWGDRSDAGGPPRKKGGRKG